MTLFKHSLKRRLTLSALAVILCFLGAMSIGLNKAFEQSVLSNAEDALRNQILLLLGNIEIHNGVITTPETLSEAKLSQLDSDMYAQIMDLDGNHLWRSPSLLEKSIHWHADSLKQQVGEYVFTQNKIEKTKTYQMSASLIWETQGKEFPFVVVVAEKQQNYLKRIKRFERHVFLWLATLAGALIVLLLVSLAWALRPLSKVSQQVHEIEQGERQQFDENYPLELNQLTQNLNHFLAFEKERVNKQRETLGNLAHSLKTPLAILHSLKWPTGTLSIQQEAKKQFTNIQRIIDYQLQSASTIGKRRFVKPILLKPMVDKVLDSLHKLYANKQINLDLKIEEQAQFPIDEGDFLELFGNIVENAFKWSNRNIVIELHTNRAQTINAKDNNTPQQKQLSILVEDDGPGIKEEQKQSILQRGVRLDSQTPGHGLGLHIVKELVEAYNGDIRITNQKPIGTKFKVDLNF